ncbi:hypothetical protein [Chitinophaga polysaccharea]|uniref:hypothetical protein n=1 Tax=Chitinophaga polysaccharea TaxID=1293035 RepID=UPI0011580E7F|nr:hypothetical protein [Chitinophaga polysaccharea]
MRTLRLASIAILLSFNLKAQDKQETTIKKDQIKAGIVVLGAGLNYEKKIFPQTTLNLNAELSYGFGRSNLNSTSGTYYALTPILSVEGRQYYNTFKRSRKGKRINNNSGSFWAIATGIKTSPLTSNKYYESPVIFWIPSWGIQRSLGNKFTFSTQLGWAFKYSTIEKEWASSPNIRIGIYYIFM